MSCVMRNLILNVKLWEIFVCICFILSWKLKYDHVTLKYISYKPWNNRKLYLSFSFTCLKLWQILPCYYLLSLTWNSYSLPRFWITFFGKFKLYGLEFDEFDHQSLRVWQHLKLNVFLNQHFVVKCLAREKNWNHIVHGRKVGSCIKERIVYRKIL